MGNWPSRFLRWLSFDDRSFFRRKLLRERKKKIILTHIEHIKRKIQNEWSVHTMLYRSKKRNTEFNYTIISRVTDMFAKEARSWLSKLNLNFELNFIPNKCDCNEWFLIADSFFSEWLKKQKNAHYKKKKVIISWIFQYFDILIGISAIQYFTVMNQSGRSILAIRNHKSIKFGFSAFTLE